MLRGDRDVVSCLARQAFHVEQRCHDVGLIVRGALALEVHDARV